MSNTLSPQAQLMAEIIRASKLLDLSPSDICERAAYRQLWTRLGRGQDVKLSTIDGVRLWIQEATDTAAKKRRPKKNSAGRLKLAAA